MRVGARIEVDISGTGRDGEGIAVVEGHEVHVRGLLGGERALVQIEHLGRRVPERPPRAFGRILEVVRPSPGRVSPPCLDHEARDGRCTGCPRMIATAELQREEKRAWLEREFALSVTEIRAGASDLGYRWSSKRVVRNLGGRVRLGSYRWDSHRVADMDRCLVDHPDIVEAAREIAQAATRLGIAAYDERTRQGDLRYVWLKTNGNGDVLVTLITASRDSRVEELAHALVRPSGVAWSVQEAEGNALRGAPAVVLRGAGTIGLALAGRFIEVGPLGFLQPNPRVAELAYLDLCSPPPERLCFDLYAGAGVTTALLAERGAEVLACDTYPESAQGLGAEPESAEAFLDRMRGQSIVPSLVVANPPRSGMGDAVCETLRAFAAMGLAELRIMSCSPAALRRDLDRLAPGFELRSLSAYDTLPHTPHVELVAKLHAGREPK